MNFQNPSPRLLLIELNEFNDPLLRELVANYKLNNLKKILELNHSHTFTKDIYESDYLEPWVQWVSVHTGHSSSIHKVKHLGDVPSLEFPQIWEVLSSLSITTGVWGVLNGSRGKESTHNLFFFPDLWTFSEKAYPPALNGLLELPRYMANDRIKTSLTPFIKSFFKFIKILISKPLFVPFLKEIPTFIKTILSYPRREFVAFCLVEYLSGLLFIHYWKKHKPQVGILFLNSMAHLQHYFWRAKDNKNNIPLEYGLKYIDKIMGGLLATLHKEDRIVVMNALSQRNVTHQPPWIAYRPVRHEVFFKGLGFDLEKIVPLMSYDALLFFKTKEDCLKAKKILESATIEGKPLFLVESYIEDPKKLFYRFVFTDPASKKAMCDIGGKKIPFYKYFAVIGQRTGEHIQSADIYINDPTFPEKLENHKVFDYIKSIWHL